MVLIGWRTYYRGQELTLALPWWCLGFKNDEFTVHHSLEVRSRAVRHPWTPDNQGIYISHTVTMSPSTFFAPGAIFITNSTSTGYAIDLQIDFDLPPSASTNAAQNPLDTLYLEDVPR